jgi:MraZ protein
MDAGEGLYLTPGTDQCLELHTDQSLNDLAERTRSSQASAQNLKSFSRLFYARASFCELDKQGRIRIPSESAELAGLKKDIVFVGVGFHWEVWDLSHWNSYLEQQDGAFDLVAHEMLSPAKNETLNIPKTLDGELSKPR